jgi:hypothetical protein
LGVQGQANWFLSLELARKPEIIKNDRPALYRKVKNTLKELMSKASPVMSAYPSDAVILREEDACLKRWPVYPGY